MTKADDLSQYRAFLVRLWRDQPSAPWRAAVEDPHTGERRAFGSLEALFAYIADQAAGAGAGEAGRQGPGGA